MSDHCLIIFGSSHEALINDLERFWPNLKRKKGEVHEQGRLTLCAALNVLKNLQKGCFLKFSGKKLKFFWTHNEKTHELLLVVGVFDPKI